MGAELVKSGLTARCRGVADLSFFGLNNLSTTMTGGRR